MAVEPDPPARRSDQVVLRPAAAEDVPWLLELAGGYEVEPFLAPGAVQGLADSVAAGEAFVAETSDGRAVGAVRAMVVNERSRIGALRSLMIDPAARGRGLGVAVVRAVTARLFEEADVHRVEAEVYGFNAGGLKVFELAGFRREGTRRRAYWRHDGWQDGVTFGLLADERE
jgi:RimJ/RimL family protein N-acetyltransferase